MRKIIEQYPSVIFKLILLNGLVAAIYMSIFLELSHGPTFYTDERAECYRFLNKYFYLLAGIVTIIAGFIVDKIKNIKSSLLIAISSAFLGGILFCFPVEPILFIGALLIFWAFIFQISY